MLRLSVDPFAAIGFVHIPPDRPARPAAPISSPPERTDALHTAIPAVHGVRTGPERSTVDSDDPQVTMARDPDGHLIVR